jgi:hypothetical protein
MIGAREIGDANLEQPGNDAKLIDELIFRQYLDEVHLLMDFVSGRGDRPLTTLAIPHPSVPGEIMTSGAIAQAVSEMRYPPGPDSAANAQNAAILLMVKDRLNALADPARGLTIAYTTLFVAAEGRRSPLTAVWRRMFGRASRSALGHDSHVDLARGAFPHLWVHARKFRRRRDAMAWFTVLWLVLTAIAYWDASLGHTALDRLNQTWKSTVEDLNSNPNLMHCNDLIAGNPAGGEVKAIDARTVLECRKYNFGTLTGKIAGEKVADVFQCKNMTLSRALHVWCWHWLLTGASRAEDGLVPYELTRDSL